MRLAQLSDCHLAANPETSYRGVSADAGVLGLVPRVAEWNPDLVLLTGDLSEDSSASSYRRLGAMLEPLAKAPLALPGNHDRPAEMSACFASGPWDGPLAAQAGAWQIVLLDSTIECRVDGRIRPEDLAFLRRWLDETPPSPVLIALHHQPVPVGSPWIDRYMLREPDEFLRLVEENPRIRCVVWGHVHQHFEGHCGAARLYACPSTALNSLPRTQRFTADPAGPACRWLELHADGSLRTGLLRAAGAPPVRSAATPARE